MAPAGAPSEAPCALRPPLLMLAAMVVGKPAVVGHATHGDLTEVEVDERQAVDLEDVQVALVGDRHVYAERAQLDAALLLEPRGDRCRKLPQALDDQLPAVGTVGLEERLELGHAATLVDIRDDLLPDADANEHARGLPLTRPVLFHMHAAIERIARGAARRDILLGDMGLFAERT